MNSQASKYDVYLENQSVEKSLRAMQLNTLSQVTEKDTSIRPKITSITLKKHQGTRLDS